MSRPREHRSSGQQVQALSASQPRQWLAAGWRDFTRAPIIGLFYGACFVVAGWLLVWIVQYSVAWTLALSAGFFLLGPLLCIGLYWVSRSLQAGQQPALVPSLTAWRKNLGALVPYLVVIVILEMLWSRSAMVVFAVSFPSLPPEGSTLAIVTNPENIGFVITYLAVGALFAGLIFATSVVSIPMMLDQDVDGITACLTSIQVCLANPGVMLLWGLLIVGLIVLAILPFFAGLLLAGPLIGHASWHAYRDSVMVAAADGTVSPSQR